MGEGNLSLTQNIKTFQNEYAKNMASGEKENTVGNGETAFRCKR